MRLTIAANLGIRGKVFAGYAILLLPFIALAAVTWFMTRLISEDATELREHSLPVLVALEAVRTAGLRVIETTNTFALINSIGGNEQDRFASFSLDKKQEMQQARQEFERAFSDFASPSDEDGGAADRTRDNIAFAHQNILKQSDKIERMAASGGKPAALLQIRERFETSAVNFRNLVQQAIDSEKAKLTAHETALNARISDAMLIVLGLSGLGLVLAIGGGYLVSGRIARPIRTLRDATLRIGAGDFEAVPARTTNDEVGELVDAFRSMTQRIKADMAARQTSEAAAKRAEARLTDAIESIGEGFVLYDAGERLVTCNQRFREIFQGIGDLMVPGTPWTDIVRKGVERGQYAEARQHPEQWIAERAQRFRHPGEPYEQKLSDGRWLRIADRRTSDGGTVGTRTDITSIKRAQAALADALADLKTSEAQFKSLVANLPGAVYRCRWDVDWTEIYLSAAIERIVGYPASDFVGNRVRSFASIVHPDDQQLLQDHVQVAADRREPYAGEFRVIHRDGSVRWVAESGQVVFGDDDRPIYLDGALFDITERKQADLELQRAHEELKVATGKLAEQERMSTMGRLTATVSHELRNPLAAIRTSLATVRGIAAGKDAAVTRALDRCDRNIARCADIIDELLDFTRARQLNREVTPLTAWLAETADELDLPEGITLERDLSAAGNVAIDRARLRQVIVNLVENATQALNDPSWQPSPGRVRSITLRTELAGPHIRLTIADTGPGIPADVLPRIFEPLFTTRGFGVGLGLPLVRQIVEQHGGTIDVDSSPGEGTAFSIWMPHAPAEHADLAVSPERVSAA